MGPELKVLGIPSEQKGSGRSIRTKKFVAPDCREIKHERGEDIWVDGPCKRASVRDWTKCTHGAPSREELKAAGWERKDVTGIITQRGDVVRRILATPPYFERAYREETQDIVEPQGDGSLLVTGQTKLKKLILRPRIIEVSASVRNSSGDGPTRAEQSGCMEPEHFGIAPFCEFYGCFEQNPKQFKNGWFCNELEAKLISADEHGTILALDYGEPSSRSRQIRREQLDSISV